ncbi:MAG: RdgB/HAM1 family non-canonical purine NTP pyrophosphatase [bacterium]|nr:RdgB/HAM1 family non-canonical purine NTP pyrophosphatase [bacterium]
MKLVFATHNKGKISEMKKIMAGLDIKILSADDVGIKKEIKEDGQTFEENALIKARFISNKKHVWSFADDSGVCIEALGCAPGIYSARWARKRGSGGAHASGNNIVKHTLQVMKHIPKKYRGAWMETACALVAPDKRHWVFTGKVHGTITLEPKGKFNAKLPYDVIFVPNGTRKTFAEMSGEKKNSLSHRGQALRELKKFLSEGVFK